MTFLILFHMTQSLGKSLQSAVIGCLTVFLSVFLQLDLCVTVHWAQPSSPVSVTSLSSCGCYFCNAKFGWIQEILSIWNIYRSLLLILEKLIYYIYITHAGRKTMVIKQFNYTFNKNKLIKNTTKILNLKRHNYGSY